MKTSTLEGAASTVYAQGGRGNARLMSWDGERTVTFTMEDALISPIGLSILTGAGLIEASESKKVIQHITETVERDSEDGKLYVQRLPHMVNNEATIYVMALDENNEVVSEPYLASCNTTKTGTKGYEIYVGENELNTHNAGYNTEDNYADKTDPIADTQIVLIDYYTAHNDGAFEVNITPDKFGGTFYLEASTLWRDQATKKDLPAEFIIPACRVQSNFTFSMSSSGDPSTFTFTMDAFPDFTRWNRTEKVLATIQVLGANLEGAEDYDRDQTWSKNTINKDGTIETAATVPVKPIIDNVTYDSGVTQININLTGFSGTITDAKIKETYDKVYAIIRDNNGAIVIDTTAPAALNFNISTGLPVGTYTVAIKGIKDNVASDVSESSTFSVANG